MKIIVEDRNILQMVCGLHDSNLAYIEQMTGAEIFYRGNYIDIPEGGDTPQAGILKDLFQQMIHLAENGYEMDSFQIQLMYDDIRRGRGLEQSEPPVQESIIVEGKRIQAKSVNQRSYMKHMHESQVVFGIGPAGTGKTFLAIAKALEELQKGLVHKIVLTRPVVEAGESLGFLPGDLTQKISPYLRPLYDAMEMMIPMHSIRKMEEQGVIEIAPLAYMRGRSLQNAFIILDEAQNTTRTQMKMFLTRIGFGAKAVITGDITQIDLPKKNQSGLLHASGLLHGITGINTIYFEPADVVRSVLVKRIIQAYEKETKQSL